MLTLIDLINTDRLPAPYEQGAELWNDLHISKMMLEAHLSPQTDAASYKPEKIQAICEYFIQATGLKTGSSIADLGCGPGLYSFQLVQKGYQLTGIDRSETSIRYARNLNRGKNADFIISSYLSPFGDNQFDSALLISQDYGVLSPDSRRILLKNIHQALKPKGFFAFDVSTMSAFEHRKERAVSKWYASDSGFWRPHQHFVLEKTIIYPDISALCDLAVVIDSEIKSYYIYQSFFSHKSIQKELEENGFHVEAILSNLWGEKYCEDSLVIGILCSKA
ncbi:class I SAM-dependent methyltransferase [Sinanaerobacter chloroacetimidivorans]|uniref:Class I SAM-dependent methyltransferase n=1 Tax=Sinanaerobacter chloroacetimidivorans TaxID=2818044 RepID=A0A8J7W1V5_9FIRM|nr:class I SAM-dependent methyltransferase [Sinanaerobacter chloroacetimidivorans]MBR0599324.1 class I SAM-dependent methyltransferase [Sinanaerobacter chloroacetimidivorans]